MACNMIWCELGTITHLYLCLLMNLNLVYRNNSGKGGLSDKLNLFDKLEKSNKELPCSLLF
jgi:hypothetical protein